MTARIDSRHGYVWRWCFACKGTTQILSGWGSWDTKRAALAALARHRAHNKRHKLTDLHAKFEVRRVPCNLVPLDNYPQEFR